MCGFRKRLASVLGLMLLFACEPEPACPGRACLPSEDMAAPSRRWPQPAWPTTARRPSSSSFGSAASLQMDAESWPRSSSSSATPPPKCARRFDDDPGRATGLAIPHLRRRSTTWTTSNWRDGRGAATDRGQARCGDGGGRQADRQTQTVARPRHSSPIFLTRITPRFSNRSAKPSPSLPTRCKADPELIARIPGPGPGSPRLRRRGPLPQGPSGTISVVASSCKIPSRPCD